MEWKRKIILVLIFHAVSVCAAPLTWNDVVSLARKQNPTLLAGFKVVESRGFAYKAATNRIYPQVNLSNSYSESDSKSSGQWSAGGEARLDVFNKQAFADIGLSAANKESSLAELELILIDVRRQLRTAFIELLFTQEQIKVAERIRALRQQNAELVSLKYDSGRESKGNMLKAGAELTEAKATVAQSERAQRLARRELSRLLGENNIVDTASGTLHVDSVPALQELDSVIDKHPSVWVKETAKKIAEASLSRERSSFWPTLSGSYSRTLTGESFFPNDKHWNISGTLTLPFLSGGPTAVSNNIASAQADAARSDLDLSAARLTVRKNLESAWLSLADRLDDSNVQEQFLTAARQRNEEATVRYSSGLMSYENWESVVTDLVNFERGFVRAQRDVAIAETEVGFAMGRPLEAL